MNNTSPPLISDLHPIALNIRNKEARVDSRQLAEHLGLAHSSVIKLIKDHGAALESFGKVGFQIGPSPDSTTGQRVRFALLNEDQTYLLLTMSRNTPRVVALKVALVRAFRETRTALTAYNDGTLPSTRELQDALKAIPGGPGPWLYSNVAKLVNATAGIAAGTRAAGGAAAQAMLILLQGLAAQAVSGATDAHDAYGRVKAALLPFGSIKQADVAA